MKKTNSVVTRRTSPKQENKKSSARMLRDDTRKVEDFFVDFEKKNNTNRK